MITYDSEIEATNIDSIATKSWISPSQSKIDQIRKDCYKKGHTIDPSLKTKSKVTFGRATKIFLNKPSEQKLRTEPKIPFELFNTPEDQTLDRALNLCQSIGYNSSRLLRKHKTGRNIKNLFRKDKEQDRNNIKYVITQEGPNNNHKQQKLRTLKTFNYIVDIFSNHMFNSNKVT